MKLFMIDGQIGIGVGVGIVAGAEEIENGLAEAVAEDRQNRRHDHQHGESGILDLLRPFLFPRAPGNGAKGRTAGGEQTAERGNQRHNGENQTHAGQCQTGGSGQMTQVDPVHNIVKHMHRLGNRQRNGLT